MPYLITILIIALLFFGFLLMTMYEQSRGQRLLASLRYRLDRKVERALFVVEHVDWGAFTAHLTRTAFTTLAHDIAHGSLVAVRATERTLTRAVRSLRSSRDNAGQLPTGPTFTESLPESPDEASGSPAMDSNDTANRSPSDETIIDAQSVKVVRSKRGIGSTNATGETLPVDRRSRKMFDIRPPSKRK